MSKQIRKFVVLLLLLSVLLVQMPLMLTANGRQAEFAASAQQRAAIEALAEYMSGHTDWTGKMLQKYCYEPSVSPTNWQHFPAVRKLVIAYEAAEAASPGIGGDKLLALLSQAMAQRYEAARREKSLRQYLQMSVNESSCVEFRNVEKRVYFSDLPHDVKNALRTIAEYSTGGPLGSPEAVIRTFLEGNPNFKADDAAGFLCQSESNADAFIRAFSFVPQHEQEAKLKAVQARLAVHNEAVRLEATLKSYAPQPQSSNSAAQSVRLRTATKQSVSKSSYVATNTQRVQTRPPTQVREPDMASTFNLQRAEQPKAPSYNFGYDRLPAYPIIINRAPQSGPFSQTYNNNGRRIPQRDFRPQSPVLSPLGGSVRAPLYTPPVRLFDSRPILQTWPQPPLIRVNPLPISRPPLLPECVDR